MPAIRRGLRVTAGQGKGWRAREGCQNKQPEKMRGERAMESERDREGQRERERPRRDRLNKESERESEGRDVHPSW